MYPASSHLNFVLVLNLESTRLIVDQRATGDLALYLSYRLHDQRLGGEIDG